jgi:peptidoglycan/LPS O-acetylase OafA/YrhL
MGRNLGLDAVRASAISLVLLAHGIGLFTGNVSLFGWLGYLGVELFFVLSGFLIGQILIAEVVRHPRIPVLVRFWVRRWLRTLPAYYVVLAVLIALGRPLPWSMLVFLQNFQPDTLVGFPASWSLAVEEWFYVFVPALLLVAVRRWRGRPQVAFFAVGAAIVGLSLAARIVYTVTLDPSWDDGIRKQVPLRMDSLVIGVLLAGARAYHPHLYARLTGGAAVLLSAAALVALTLYWQTGLAGGYRASESFFARTGMFDVVSIAFAVLIGALERGWTHSATVLTRPIEELSRVSYSVYLVHFDAFLFTREHALWDTPVLRVVPLSPPAVSALVALALTALVATALYCAVERPFMALRDRLVPSIGSLRRQPPRERRVEVSNSRGI